MAAKQAAILDSAARLLKSGGRLVYATCSLLQQENEAVAEAFSAAHPDFEPVPVAELLERLLAPLPSEVVDKLCSGGEKGRNHLHLWPHRHNTDGFFAAVWRKR
jgi:16S rRNA (cytosine967-C5)-methyltransferase